MNMIENKIANEKLLSGTIIYFIGNVLTQLISIILLKLITGKISADQYGYFNLVVTIDNFITPVLTLQISDAVFRFLLKSKTEEEKKAVYTNGTVIIFIGAFLACILVFFLKDAINIKYPAWVVAYIISTNIFSYNQRVIRSIGKNKEYVVSNLIKAALYLLFQILFVIKLNMGVKGLFIANCFSTFICVVILIISVKTFQYFDFRSFDFPLTKKMIRFSAPLIPNTAIWWLQSSVNSIIITKKMGLDYNGIYSAALKLASVMNLVITVFNLSWQETAIREYGSDGYNEFVTKTFNTYLTFLISCCSMLIPLTKLFAQYFLNESYYDALKYIPVLLISTSFSAFSGFFAQIITAKNKNIKLLSTNALGAIVNIIIVMGLLNHLNLWAVIISSVCTNVCLSFSRFFEVREIIDIREIRWNNIVFLFAFLSLSLLSYYKCETLINIILFAISIGIGIYINIDLIKLIVNVLNVKDRY